MTVSSFSPTNRFRPNHAAVFPYVSERNTTSSVGPRDPILLAEPMRQLIAKIVTLTTLTLLVACGTPQKDLEGICELVTETQKDKSKNQDQKTIHIMKNLRSVVSTSEVSDLIEKISKTKKKKTRK